MTGEDNAPVPPNRLLAIGIYFSLLSLYLLTASGHFYSTDHLGMYEATKSFVNHGGYEVPAKVGTPGKNGFYAPAEPGLAYVAAPLYLLGSAVDAAAPGLRRYFGGPLIGQWDPPPLLFGGNVTIFFVSLTNQLVGPLIAVVLFYLCLHLGFRSLASAATALSYGVATMAFPGAHEFFAHPIETLCLLGPLTILIEHRQALRPGDTIYAGAVLGFGIITRLNLLLIAPLFVLYVLYVRLRVDWRLVSIDHLKQQVSGDRRLLLGFIAPVAASVIIVLVLNVVRFGSALAGHASAGGSLSLGTLPEGLYGYLLSPGRSFFLYSPPTLAGVLAYRRFLRAHAPEAVLFAAVAGVFVLLYGSFQFWPGAGCWGPRYLEPLVPLLMVPAAYWLESAAGRVGFGLLTALGVVIATAGVVVNPVYAEEWRGLWGGGVTAPFQANAYLYVPSISPPVIHLQDLLAHRNWDLWLEFVAKTYGTPTLLVSLFVPLVCLALSAMAFRAFHQRTRDRLDLNVVELAT